MLKLDKTGSVPQLYLYGTIMKDAWWMDGGEAISAAAVLDLIEQLDPGSDLVVRINSDGGDVFEGVAIYNALARRQARVETHVDALAASIASVIAMAGDEIVLAGNAMLMIHQAWTVAAGNAAELTKVAETLAAVDKTIIDTYEARAGKKSSREQIVAWVEAETWMGAAEAIERGFADRAGDLKGVEASVRPEQFRNTPKALLRKPESKGQQDPGRSAPNLVPAIAARIRAVRARLGEREPVRWESPRG